MVQNVTREQTLERIEGAITCPLQNPEVMRAQLNINVNVICLFSLGACNITDALVAIRVCSTCLGPSVRKKIKYIII